MSLRVRPSPLGDHVVNGIAGSAMMPANSPLGSFIRVTLLYGAHHFFCCFGRLDAAGAADTCSLRTSASINSMAANNAFRRV